MTRRWLLGGGIGCGKSTVRVLLERHGMETIDADSIGHRVLDGPALPVIAERWPEVVSGGKVDRASLGAVVFGDRSQLVELEAITHPHIFGTIAGLVEGISTTVVVEIPLLRKAPPGVWGRVVVDCDDRIRLERLVGRGMPPDDALARIRSQASRAEWLAVADIVVPNHGDPDDLEETVSRLLPLLSTDY